MAGKHLDIGLMITIATILVSVGGAFGVVQAKTKDVDDIKIKVELNDKKVAVLEANVGAIMDGVKEQKEDFKDFKRDLKEILRELKK